MHKEYHGFLYGIAAAFLSAGIAILMKWIQAPAETVIFFRFAVGFPLVWMAAYQQGQSSLTWGGWKKHIWTSVLGLLTVYIYIYALRIIPVVNAITLINTAPLFAPLIVVFWLKLKVPKRRLIATAVGFVGVCILLRPGKDLFASWGSVMGLITGVTSAMVLVGIRQLSKEESSARILLYYSVFTTLVTFYPMIITWEPIDSLTAWSGLIGIGLVGLGYQYCLTKSYTHAAATKVSLCSYAGIVFGGLGAWIIFGEIPDLLVWIGTGFIIVSALLAFFE